MTDERWLLAAISDDKVVADLLLHLKYSSDLASDDAETPTPSPACFSLLKPLLPPSWGARQPRSRLASSASSEKKGEIRRSPTTPLSWTSEGCEESSSLNNNYSLSQLHPPPSDRFRSKNSVVSDTPATSSKRPRRKKTFAELKEEESTLMKERIHLNKELATMRQTLIEQRSVNEKLKRIKIDPQVDFGLKIEASSVDHDGHSLTHKGTSEASSSSSSKKIKNEDAAEHSCSEQKGFVLPDLNMAPGEEHPDRVRGVGASVTWRSQYGSSRKPKGGRWVTHAELDDVKQELDKKYQRRFQLIEQMLAAVVPKKHIDKLVACKDKNSLI